MIASGDSIQPVDPRRGSEGQPGPGGGQVNRSELARRALSRCELTIDQAAVIAEFDDGTPHGTEAVKVLTVTARTQPAHFEHAAQRPRDERTEREIIAARTEELRGKGIAVLSTDLVVAAAALTGLRPRADDQSGTWTRKPTLFVALYSGASPSNSEQRLSTIVTSPSAHSRHCSSDRVPIGPSRQQS